MPQDEPTVGSDHSEQVKSLLDDPEPTNTGGKGSDEQNAAKECEQNEDNKKDKTDEEDSSSDKPAGQVKVDQTEDSVKENHESSADEPIKEDEHEHGQKSQEEGNKDLPSTTEDSGVSVEQGVDDSLQLVSLVCTFPNTWQIFVPVCNEINMT